MPEIRQHIFLTGFMGSGKSTAGKKLAKLLGVPFADLDEEISKAEQKTIPEIFQTNGENYFREKEIKFLKELNAGQPYSVIALGGGTVCFENNLALVKNKGLLVYIEMPAAALCTRLKNSIAKRPLLQDTAGKTFEEHISSLLEKRKPFYEQAHLKVNGLDLSPQHLETLVRAVLQENKS